MIEVPLQKGHVTSKGDHRQLGGIAQEDIEFFIRLKQRLLLNLDLG